MREMKKEKKQVHKKRWNGISPRDAFLLVILCLLVYANGLSGEFVWDDQLQLFRNVNIRSVDNIPRAFTTSLWSFMYAQDPATNNNAFDRYYRPLQTVIYILVYQIAGLSPFAYHLANVILHCIATLLVYLVCRQLGLDSVIALLAGVLFAVHPVHTEAVTWIAGVGDVACGIFYFAALLTFLRHLDTENVKWLWLSLICFLAALFSKEMAATLPGVVFLIFMTRKAAKPNLKAAVRIVSPYILVMGVYAGFRITAAGLGAASVVEGRAGVVDWATLVILVLGGYLRYAIVPYPLYIFHMAPIHFADRIVPTLYSVAIITASFLVLTIWRRRFSKPLLWLVIFFVTLLPVLYFKGFVSTPFTSRFLAEPGFAERYLYIPSLAVTVVAGFFLADLKRTHALLAACGIIGVFSFLTIQRNRDWHNEESLYQRTLQFQPEAVHIWTSLGEVYLQQGQDARAETHFKSAMQYLDDPRFIYDSYESYRIYHGLGLAAARQAKPAEAVAYLKKALEIYPQGDAAYTTLGGVFVSQGWDYSGAVALLDKAIKLNPVNDLAKDYMGVVLMNQGQVEPAIQYFREALQINPDLESAKQHLEVAMRVQKK
jgi:Tfp pilus assembly protein PilF